MPSSGLCGKKSVAINNYDQKKILHIVAETQTQNTSTMGHEWHELSTTGLVPKCTLPRRRVEPRSDVDDFMRELYYEWHWHHRAPAVPRRGRRVRSRARQNSGEERGEALDSELVDRLAALAAFERLAHAEPGTHAEVTVTSIAERAEAASVLAASAPTSVTVPSFMHELVLTEKCCDVAVALRLHAIKWSVVALLKSSPRMVDPRKLRAVAGALPQAAGLTPYSDETQMEAATIATTCIGCTEAHEIFELHGAGWSTTNRRLWKAMTADGAFRCPRCSRGRVVSML